MTPFPTRHSTRLRNPPVRLAYRAHADTSPNYTGIPPDLIMEMQHAYTTEVDNAMDFNTTDPQQYLPPPDNWSQVMKLPPRTKKFWIASFVKELKEVCKKGTVEHDTHPTRTTLSFQ
jgi:hypothetical protein